MSFTASVYLCMASPAMLTSTSDYKSAQTRCVRACVSMSVRWTPSTKTRRDRHTQTWVLISCLTLISVQRQAHTHSGVTLSSFAVLVDLRCYSIIPKYFICPLHLKIVHASTEKWVDLLCCTINSHKGINAGAIGHNNFNPPTVSSFTCCLRK